MAGPEGCAAAPLRHVTRRRSIEAALAGKLLSLKLCVALADEQRRERSWPCGLVAALCLSAAPALDQQRPHRNARKYPLNLRRTEEVRELTLEHLSKALQQAS
ncbi:hypothetical protein MTO96_040716 [Rhipicephalus appendiculatus]